MSVVVLYSRRKLGPFDRCYHVIHGRNPVKAKSAHFTLPLSTDAAIPDSGMFNKNVGRMTLFITMSLIIKETERIRNRKQQCSWKDAPQGMRHDCNQCLTLTRPSWPECICSDGSSLGLVSASMRNSKLSCSQSTWIGTLMAQRAHKPLSNCSLARSNPSTFSVQILTSSSHLESG